MSFEQLYFVRQEHIEIFGEYWCGPGKLEHGEDVLIARYPKDNGDGQSVDIYCCAMPARFYILKVLADVNSVDESQVAYEVSTGSSQAGLAALIAKAISGGMLGFKPEGRTKWAWFKILKSWFSTFCKDSKFFCKSRLKTGTFDRLGIEFMKKKVSLYRGKTDG